MPLRARRMKGLRIDEASGVDAPAHLTPGWMVMKSADGGDPFDDLTDEQIEALIKAAEAEEANEEEPMTASVTSMLKKLGEVNAARDAALAQAKAAEDELAARRLAKAKAAAGDPIARMEAAVAALQTTTPALSRPEAFVKAADADPALAAAYQEADTLRSPPADPVQKADENPHWAAIEKAASAIQSKAPAMDRATAITRAADLHPELVRAYNDRG